LELGTAGFLLAYPLFLFDLEDLLCYNFLSYQISRRKENEGREREKEKSQSKRERERP
jgi:hypothetical protein